MAKTVKVPIYDAIKDCTLTVKIQGYTKFKIRLWIGKMIIAFGVRIIGIPIKWEGIDKEGV